MAIWNKLKILTRPSTRLSQRVAFAGAWMLVIRVMERGFGVVRIIVLVRLLTPEAFGLVAIALLAMELIKALTNLHFNAALVQRKGDIKNYLDTAWVFAVMRGLVLGGILVGTAPWVAAYFNSSDAKPIIQAMAAVLVLNGFLNSGIIYLYKELEVHKRFVYETSRTLADLAVTISAALILRNAWALVYGAVAASLIGMVVSYVIHSYRPKVRFDLQKAKDLFDFGKWAFSNSVANYIFIRVDSIFVGRLLGVVTLGLYEVAHRIGDTLSREMNSIHQHVAFPTYAKLQDNISSLRQAFSAGIEATALLTFPIATALFVLAPEFTTLVLGTQWISSVPAMQILGIAAAINSLLGVGGGTLYYAVGKPRLAFFMKATAASVMVALVLPLIRVLGINGAAMAVLIGNVAGLLFVALASMRILKIGVIDMIRPLLSPLAISLPLGITLVLVKYAAGQVNLGEFILMLCIGAAVYVGLALMLWRFFRSGPIQILALLRGGSQSSTESVSSD